MSVELNRVESGGDGAVEEVVVGIDEDADALDMRRNPTGQRRRLIGREVARTRREEDETEMARPGGDGGIDRLGRRQAANLDLCHRLAAIAAAAAAGSGAAVIGRPMTSIDAPAASACRGDMARFWSPASLPSGRTPGTTK